MADIKFYTLVLQNKFNPIQWWQSRDVMFIEVLSSESN